MAGLFQKLTKDSKVDQGNAWIVADKFYIRRLVCFYPLTYENIFAASLSHKVSQEAGAIPKEESQMLSTGGHVYSPGTLGRLPIIASKGMAS